jgi:hypothetical protein
MGFNPYMTESATVEVQIVASSLEEIQEILGLQGEVPDGALTVAAGVELQDLRVSRSSGFDGTQYVLDAVMSVVTSVSSGLLTVWLGERLKNRPKVAATIDGEEVPPASGDSGRTPGPT